ncbi:MAG TPA: 1-deoxy-D-xylulose-5-phosphate synthase [Candidatus Margulisbacteria bacterium]|nr:MAG: 1-deoxy-D-xylulose-5-phosphate synthase [Candidatus Margulisbacteria bacterium GWF2_38_17]OGI08196.1 MAG: 1-deoxy-D-xylulose-5-phosphate synthase [Candidatus Margulisbacteria bacterium GWE2_39_32]HCT85065.1 1-deoxy-D-xylulose-5-phosphate synthase [Candidatus Margulisiibacteriota bacterium]
MPTKLIDTIELPDDLKKLSINELEQICQEIRELLISTVSKSGGHLAPSLGVVELTVALHTVLTSPEDKLIWDVGHQAYVHKILTGRKDSISTIRQLGGLSGFPRRNESQHDAFGTGHASTSISAALGIAVARDIKGEDFSVFSIIGDGSTSGGLAFEAINNVPCSVKGNFVVILNDNGLSISKPVGSLSNAITRVRTSSTYLSIKNNVESLINRIPKIGSPLSKKIEKLVDRTKNLVTDYKVGVIFEELGFRYLGPIDGHNIPLLMGAISYARRSTKPILIHVITKKGKGYLPAEDDPEKFHGISPFHIESGKIETSHKNPSYTETFGKTICDLANLDNRICAITAAMPSGTGLSEFQKKFPHRFFDVGIAEEHAVTFAAGLTVEGMKPFVAVYSSFMQRAYDQIIHDVCIQNLPVVFMLDRGGLVGEDGPTHHGVFDFGYLRHIPNLTVMAPKDQNELVDMMYFALSFNGPISIRYPRGEGAISVLKEKADELILGKAEILFAQNDGYKNNICIIAIGTMVPSAIEVAQRLFFSKVNTTVINARFIKPLDEKLISALSRESDLVVTMEEGAIQGGFGSAVLELLSKEGIITRTLCLGIPDKFIEHGSKKELMQKYQLDTDGMFQKILAKIFEPSEAGYIKASAI